MAAKELDAAAFAELVKLMSDIRRNQAAQLLELRAIRMALTDTATDNPTAVETAKKAEGSTLDAVAGSSSSSDFIERMMKKKFAKEMGIPLDGNIDDAVLEKMIEAQFMGGGEKPTP